MTYIIIALSFLVVVLLVGKASKSQLQKLERKLENYFYQRHQRLQNAMFRSQNHDRRQLHDHIRSLESKIDKLSNVSKEADLQLLKVVSELAEKSGYELKVVEQEPQPEVPAGEVLALLKKLANKRK